MKITTAQLRQIIREEIQRMKKEGVDMTELEHELKRLKKENPNKKVTYSFTKDSPKGYYIRIDGKIVKK